MRIARLLGSELWFGRVWDSAVEQLTRRAVDFRVLGRRKVRLTMPVARSAKGVTEFIIVPGP
jgi:hypothetical protein